MSIIIDIRVMRVVVEMLMERIRGARGSCISVRPRHVADAVKQARLMEDGQALATARYVLAVLANAGLVTRVKRSRSLYMVCRGSKLWEAARNGSTVDEVLELLKNV